MLHMHMKAWEALDYTANTSINTDWLIDKLIDNTHMDDSEEFRVF